MRTFATRIRISLVRSACAVFLLMTGLACGGRKTSPPAPAPTGLRYATNPATYTRGVAITPNLPTLATGSAQTWAVHPSLPEGLSLNPVTGAITGTPEVLSAQAAYTVRATHPSGAATTTLILTVNPAPPVIGTPPVNQVLSLGESATFNVAVTGTGPLRYQWQKDQVDIPGATQATHTTLPVTRGDDGSTFRVRVTDAYGAAVTSPEATLSVLSGGVSLLQDLGSSLHGHQAVPLQDGRILVTGGRGGQGLSLTAEVFDPATGLFTPTLGAPMQPRVGGTATMLEDGRVLLAGGWNPAGFVALAEVFDPVTGQFHAAGMLKRPRAHHTSTRLPGGQVLVVGGYDGLVVDSAEVFDPATLSFRPALGNLSTPRTFHAAAMLGDGKVLVLGGLNASALATCEVFNPATEAFSPAENLITARYLATVTELQDGSLLVVGGLGASGTLADAELRGAGGFSSVGNLGQARQLHAATRLDDGTVLVSGGWDGQAARSTFERYDPATRTFQRVSGALGGFHSHAAVSLGDGSVLLVGGYNTAPLHTVRRWAK